MAGYSASFLYLLVSGLFHCHDLFRDLVRRCSFHVVKVISASRPNPPASCPCGTAALPPVCIILLEGCKWTLTRPTLAAGTVKRAARRPSHNHPCIPIIPKSSACYHTLRPQDLSLAIVGLAASIADAAAYNDRSASSVSRLNPFIATNFPFPPRSDLLHSC